MPYTIELAPKAARQFRKLPAHARKRLARHIDALAENPRPSGAKKLAGGGQLYRMRVGDYRLVYTIRDDVLLILVVAVGSRRDIYKALFRKRRGKRGA